MQRYDDLTNFSFLFFLSKIYKTLCLFRPQNFLQRLLIFSYSFLF